MGTAQAFCVHPQPATNVSATNVLPRGRQASAPGAASGGVAGIAGIAETRWHWCWQ
jgi:hypothetical protein